jgi:hypothetical protein
VPPPSTGSGLSDPAIDRSAALETVVVSVSELLPGVGSDVAAATVAVLLRVVPPFGAVTVTLMLGAVATLSVPRVHVTVPEAWLHVHPEPAALTNETPAGRLSVTVSELAVLGPALATDRVYVMFAPGATGSALSDFVIDRSAAAVIVGALGVGVVRGDGIGRGGGNRRGVRERSARGGDRRVDRDRGSGRDSSVARVQVTCRTRDRRSSRCPWRRRTRRRPAGCR